MAQRRNISWGSGLLVLVVGGIAAGGAMWMTSIQQLERTITRKRSTLKPLQLPGRTPPNREVHEYLVARTQALDRAYHAALQRVVSEAAVGDGRTSPQLFFQERLHEVQRDLERLATARTIDPPEALGLPKELPPVDVVPRLLVQLNLIQDASELIISQGNARLLSVKLEDPEALPPPSEEQGAFLMRLPVRFRFRCSLTALTKILGMVERAKPFMDVQGLSTRLPATSDASAAEQPSDKSPDKGKSKNDKAPPRAPAAQTAQTLEVDLVLARYLATAPDVPSVGEEAEAEKGARPAKKSSGPRRATPAEE